jgi:hypothetical protein
MVCLHFFFKADCRWLGSVELKVNAAAGYLCSQYQSKMLDCVKATARPSLRHSGASGNFNGQRRVLTFRSARTRSRMLRFRGHAAGRTTDVRPRKGHMIGWVSSVGVLFAFGIRVVVSSWVLFSSKSAT